MKFKQSLLYILYIAIVVKKVIILNSFKKMFREMKERSSDNLLKAAKRLINKKPSSRKEVEHEKTRKLIPAPSMNIKVNNNTRVREIRKFVEMSPAQFMSWWITSTGAKRKASNCILHYMKYKFNVKIPTDYRTLLRTPVKPVPLIVFPGSYIHLGVRDALRRLMAEAGNPTVLELLLQFFVDGVQISKSTKEDLWIIMTNILNSSVNRLTPKVIGIYLGEKKPKDFNEFLWPFVMELLDLLDEGLDHQGKNVKLKILNFVLDAPARTSCKAVKHVTGYHGCDYCIEEGVYLDYRMTFLNLDAKLRTDTEYRNRMYDEYHHKESVLELLPIDMIYSFPPDYLHFLLLGVVLWILKHILETSKLLSSNDLKEIKRRVELFQSLQPTEFQRKLRPFTEYLGLLKGTEFRQYLLFVAPVLFKGILSDKMVGNFIKLQIASLIFTHKRFECYYEEADKLMRMFIAEFAEIYHPRHVVYCVHSLCHVRTFVEKYGPLDNFSTFEYESYNGTVKHFLQSNVMPLTQITNRIVEIYNAPLQDLNQVKCDIEIKALQEDGSYSQLKYFDLTFNVDSAGQNLVLLKSGQAVKLIHIVNDPITPTVDLVGVPLLNRSSVYDIVDTTRFNVFKSNGQFGHPVTFKVNDIDGKLWQLNISDSDSSAYFPIYVEDGKSFSRKLQPNKL